MDRTNPAARWRRIGGIVPALLLGTAILAFAGGEDDPAPAASEPKYTFAIVYPLVHPFFEPVTEHAIQVGKELGVDLVFRAPEGKNVAQQITMMDELIEMGVDGIALCATDPVALVDSVDRAMDRGIPVIAFESDIPGSRRICFLGTDNYRAGQHMAELLARVLNYEGSVIICTGLSTQMSLNQRIRGIQDVLAEKYPGVTIADLRSGEGDPELTYRVIEQQIAEHPDFDVFTSIDATGGPVAVSIWKARAWRGGAPTIVTFDDMPRNLEAVRTEIAAGIVSQKQWTWGPLIIERLLAIKAGAEVPDYLDTGTVEITRENVDTYRDD